MAKRRNNTASREDATIHTDVPNRRLVETTTTDADSPEHVEGVRRIQQHKVRFLGRAHLPVHRLDDASGIGGATGDLTDEDKKSKLKVLRWKEASKLYIKRAQALQDNLRDLFSLIRVHHSDAQFL